MRQFIRQHLDFFAILIFVILAGSKIYLNHRKWEKHFQPPEKSEYQQMKHVEVEPVCNVSGNNRTTYSYKLYLDEHDNPIILMNNHDYDENSHTCEVFFRKGTGNWKRYKICEEYMHSLYLGKEIRIIGHWANPMYSKKGDSATALFRLSEDHVSMDYLVTDRLHHRIYALDSFNRPIVSSYDGTTTSMKDIYWFYDGNRTREISNQIKEYSGAKVIPNPDGNGFHLFTLSEIAGNRSTLWKMHITSEGEKTGIETIDVNVGVFQVLMDKSKSFHAVYEKNSSIIHATDMSGSWKICEVFSLATKGNDWKRACLSPKGNLHLVLWDNSYKRIKEKYSIDTYLTFHERMLGFVFNGEEWKEYELFRPEEFMEFSSMEKGISFRIDRKATWHIVYVDPDKKSLMYMRASHNNLSADNNGKTSKLERFFKENNAVNLFEKAYRASPDYY